MADKPTQLVVAALTRAATDPGGLPLFGTKAEPGLFPATAAARAAAQRCKDEAYLRVVRTEAKGKSAREICALTEKGLLYLLRQANPRQVLEDFVRALESRQEQVRALLDAAARMEQSLRGMRGAVEQILPQLRADPAERLPANLLTPVRDGEVGPREPAPCPAGDPDTSPTANGEMNMNGCATLTAPARAAVRPDLRSALLARLNEWHLGAGASEDCPLPELYRRLCPGGPPPTIGEFHDCLRLLHEE
ncbi:MAG TPA: hypothetical protein VIL46_08990, partial [Gemmataceae bacterium]